MKRRILLASGIAAAVATLAGAAILRSSKGESSWVELGGVEELRERFNEDAGATRIVLLLSPT